MALCCPNCGSDLTETGIGDRANCLGCGKAFRPDRSETLEHGLEWTSEVPASHAETARRTAEAAG